MSLGYYVRTLLRDEQIQELEVELRETRLVWDVIVIGEERRRDECFTILQTGYLLCHYMEKESKAGVCFLIDKKLKDHIVKVSSIRLRVTKTKTCSVLQTEDSSCICTNYTILGRIINSFYNDVNETVGKPNH